MTDTIETDVPIGEGSAGQAAALAAREAGARVTLLYSGHARADFPEMDPGWIRKQTLALGAKGRLQIDDVKLAAADPRAASGEQPPLTRTGVSVKIQVRRLAIALAIAGPLAVAATAKSSAAPINGMSIKAAVPAVTTDVRYRAHRNYPYPSYSDYPTYYSGYPTYYYYGYPGYRTYSPYWNAYGWW